jgi:hypothetical protein
MSDIGAAGLMTREKEGYGVDGKTGVSRPDDGA